MLKLGLLHKYHQRHARKGKKWSQFSHIQGDEQTCYRSADIGAHSDPDRLVQGHHTCVDKAYHHDSGSGGGLNHCRNGGAHQHA